MAAKNTAFGRFQLLVANAPEFAGEDFVLINDDQYEEVLKSIKDHKYLLNQGIPYEITMRDALYSWYENVYEPIVLAIDDEGVSAAFPGHSRAELFLWVCRHWHYLKEARAKDVSVEEAVRSYAAQFAKDGFTRFVYKIRQAVA
jgi:hypothetical protein